MARWLGQRGLTMRFALASALLLAVLGLVLSRRFGDLVADSAVSEEEEDVEAIVVRGLLEHLTPTDLANGLAPERLQELDRFVGTTVISARTLRVRVWSREGALIYATGSTGAGAVEPLGGPERRALGGETVSEIGTSSGGRGPILAVHSPIIFPGSGGIDGVLEVDRSYGPIAERIADAQRELAIIVSVGLLMLYIGLVGIVNGGSRMIARQRKALEASAAEKASLAAIVESSGDAIVMRDRDGRITYWNGGAELVSGRPASEMLGLSPAASAPDDREDESDAAVARALAGETVGPYETTRLHRDGRTLDVSVSMFPTRDAEGAVVGVAAIGRDITRMKEAERALAASERRYVGLISSIEAIVWEADAETFAFTFVSPHAEAMLGYPLAAWREGGFWAAHIHPEDREAAVNLCVEATGRCENHEFEYRMIAADGRTVWLHDLVTVESEDGRPTMLRGVMFDITRRKEADAAIARLAAVVESANEAFFVTDSEGTILGWNRAAERLTGCPVDAAIGLPVAEASGLPELGEAVAGVARGARTEHLEIQGEGGDGSKSLLISVFPVPAANGGLEGVGGIAYDITDRKAMEAAILQAQKLESLAVLAGGVAHDFNNLLTVIIGSACLAARKLDASSSALAEIGEIEEAAQRGARLAAAMLAYAGAADPLMRPLDLNTVAHETMRLLMPTIGLRRKMELHLAADLPLVRGDATQVRQALMNLASNASEATEEQSGLIEVSTGVIDAGDAYLARAAPGPRPPAGLYAFIEVADNGHGMDAEVRARIFDPFFSTRFAGRGLGLAAVLGAMRSHGGTVVVESVPGKGSRFRLLLPVADNAPA